MFLYKLFQVVFWLPMKVFMPTKVVGKENLTKGGAVLVCNHQSALDIILIGTNIFRQQKFLAKKELFEKKCKAKFYKAMGGIPIDREKPELSVIKECLYLLKNDGRLLIFPEGTRKEDNTLEDIKSGAYVFALKSKKPITPMWIEKKPKFFRFNTLRIGKPIYLDKYYDKRLTEEENKEIESLLVSSLLDLKNQNKKTLSIDNQAKN